MHAPVPVRGARALARVEVDKDIMKKLFGFVIVCTIFLGGCSSPTPEPTETATLTSTVTNTSTITPSLTATLTPTSTFTPTLTFTNTATLTPTPLPRAVITSETARIRSGPGLVYTVLIQYYNAQGIELVVLGRDSESEWLVVEISSRQYGWIDTEEVEFSLNLDGLREYDTPPTPIPTLTPTPTPYISVQYIGDYCYVVARNLKPYEPIQVKLASNGKKGSFNAKANANGIYSLQKLSTKAFSGTTLIVTVIGEYGSFAQIQIIFP